MASTSRVALVTGAAQGIGQQTAIVLAQRGFSVVLNDIRESTATSEQIREAGGFAANAVTDISDEPSVRNMVTAIVERFGRIDVLVNNAGISLQRPAETTTLAEW